MTIKPRRRNRFTLTGKNLVRARRLLLEVVEVLDEAYQILRDPMRRSRYQRAIEATPR